MSRAKTALTDLFLKSVEAPSKGRIVIADSQVAGFSVRVSANGAKTFSVLLYEQGRRKRVTLGRYPTMKLGEARKLAAAAIREASLGKPATAAVPAKAHRDGLTVDRLIDQFLEMHVRTKLKEQTIRQYEYRLNTLVRPKLGQLLAGDVRKRDVIALGDTIACTGKPVKKSKGRGGKGGNRTGGARRLADATIDIVSSMYGWAQKRDMLEVNPAHRVMKYGVAGHRDRVLSDGEFATFWIGVKSPAIGEPLPTILRLLLLTGQRRGEVAGARVSELELRSNQPAWTIHRDRTKNGLTHTVPLAPMALELWREVIAKFADGEFVFPATRAGATRHIHPGSVTHAMALIRTKLGLGDFRAHDLRRTVRTRMAALRIPREISARVLNHVDEYQFGTHDESYNRHEYFDEKLAALVAWEAELRRLIALASASGNESPEASIAA